jgi:hypothetical protein
MLTGELKLLLKEFDIEDNEVAQKFNYPGARK